MTSNYGIRMRAQYASYACVVLSGITLMEFMGVINQSDNLMLCCITFPLATKYVWHSTRAPNRKLLSIFEEANMISVQY